MTGRPSREAIEIDDDASAMLSEQIGRVGATGGWINLTPGVPADVAAEPPRSLFSWLVGSNGPAAPMATWMPSASGADRPGQLGVLHARGRLNREGIAGLVSVPPSWRCLGDHARRGLIFEVKATTDAEIADVMLAVVEELTTVPTTGRYLAEVFVRPG